ncbi:hypothetical protein L873DRAFT_879189 [Choiromyces venosus 120613-1]|uniref:Uncharacterized protein n=1 Tax=Choiromyces venosus 120613-1 TaxID=1336337 RepID=A0A3N4JU99_9PEZI|nr:hypothetical protein L873DRAFT_879189 [Choiromyces venosus 120613-1]
MLRNLVVGIRTLCITCAFLHTDAFLLFATLSSASLPFFLLFFSSFSLLKYKKPNRTSPFVRSLNTIRTRET